MVANFLASAGQQVLRNLPQFTSMMFGGGGGIDAGSSKDLMAYQSALWKNNTEWYNNNILAHAYKTTRNSLEEAGYNPLMALSNGALYDQGPMPNATGNSSAKSISMNQLAKSQVANVNADTMLKGAQTEQQISSANLLNQQRETEIYTTRLEQLHTEMQEIENKIRNKDYDSYDIRLYNELRQTEIKMYDALTNRYNAQSNRTIASANEYNAKTNRINAIKSRDWTPENKVKNNAYNYVEKKAHEQYDKIEKNKYWRTNVETLPNGKKITVRQYR